MTALSNPFPLIFFVLITTFTPGPSNISSASMGVLHGYKKSFNYLLGQASGFFIVMAVSGWLSVALLNVFPALESILRYAGAVYILYLAFGILKASYTFDEENVKPLGFVHGITLQILNPKLIVYAFSLFAAFLAPIIHNLTWLVLALIPLTLTAFCSVSVWALFGTGIKRYLHSARAKTIVNVLLSLSLVYTAIELAGIF